jgi:hypothetical protein
MSTSYKTRGELYILNVNMKLVVTRNNIACVCTTFVIVQSLCVCACVCVCVCVCVCTAVNEHISTYGYVNGKYQLKHFLDNISNVFLTLRLYTEDIVSRLFLRCS